MLGVCTRHSFGLRCCDVVHCSESLGDSGEWVGLVMGLGWWGGEDRIYAALTSRVNTIFRFE